MEILCSHAPWTYLVLTIVAGPDRPSPLAPTASTDPNRSALSVGMSRADAAVTGAVLPVDRELEAMAGGARQRCGGWAETTPVPTAALKPTVPFEVHEFVH